MRRSSVAVFARHYLCLTGIGLLAVCRALCTELDPVSGDMNANEGLRSLAQSCINNSDFSGALAAANKIIARNQDDREAYQLRCTARRELGDFAGMEADAGDVIRLRPDNDWAYRQRGYARTKLEKYDAAMADLDWALILNPNNAATIRYRAINNLERGERAAALDDFDKLIIKDPGNLSDQIFRAEVRAQLGFFEKALFDCNDVIEIKPFAYAYFARGMIYHKMGLDKAALRDLGKAIEMESNYYDAFHGRAEIKESMGDFAGAEDEYTQILKQEPEHFTSYNNRGYLRMRDKRYEAALSDLEAAIALNPSNVSVAYLNRSMVKRLQGKKAEVLPDVERAIALQPRYAEAYRHRALYRYCEGDFAGAIADYNEAAKLSIDRTCSDLCYRTLLLRRAGQDDRQGELVKAMKACSDTWLRAMGQYLTGSLTEDAFLKKAGEGRGSAIQRQLCAAFYVVGITHLIQGGEKEAKLYLQKCLDTKAHTLLEYVMAEADLSRISMRP